MTNRSETIEKLLGAHVTGSGTITRAIDISELGRVDKTAAQTTAELNDEETDSDD